MDELTPLGCPGSSWYSRRREDKRLQEERRSAKCNVQAIERGNYLREGAARVNNQRSVLKRDRSTTNRVQRVWTNENEWRKISNWLYVRRMYALLSRESSVAIRSEVSKNLKEFISVMTSKQEETVLKIIHEYMVDQHESVRMYLVDSCILILKAPPVDWPHVTPEQQVARSIRIKNS